MSLFHFSVSVGPCQRAGVQNRSALEHVELNRVQALLILLIRAALNTALARPSVCNEKPCLSCSIWSIWLSVTPV